MYFIIGICLNTQAYYVGHNTGFVFIEVVPLHDCYMFRNFVMASWGMSTKNNYKGKYKKVTQLFYFILSYFVRFIVLTYYIDILYWHIILTYCIDILYWHIILTYYIDILYWHIILTYIGILYWHSILTYHIDILYWHVWWWPKKSPKHVARM
jgi:hypothetical protein